MTDSAFDILNNSILSKPRMMGTPGEKEVTRFLLEFLTQHQANPFTEEIEWSTSSVNGRKILFLLMGAFLVLFNVTLRLAAPQNGIATIGLILLSIAVLFLFGKGLVNHKFKFLGKSSAGQNVFCNIDPIEKNENAPIIYFTAHTDSVASNMPSIYIKLLIGALLGFLLVIVLTLISSVVSLVAFANEGPAPAFVNTLHLIIMITSGIIIFFIITNLFGTRVNTSPGACDNGSGSAILLKLAAHFQANPLQNAHLKFIWFTAEEWGLFGSKEYVTAHKEELLAQKELSYLINVDMVGTELAYVNKAGLILRKPLNKKLNGIIAAAAAEANIEARGYNTVMGNNSDHAPFRKEKMEVAFFLAQKDVKRIHSPKDTIDHVKPEKMADAVELLKIVAQKLDCV